jgi:predicted DNA-binding protein
MAKKAGRGAEQFMLRLPDGMRDRIRAYADDTDVSMNQAIVDALEEHFPSPPTDDDIMDDISRILTLDPQLLKPLARYNLHEALAELASRLEDSQPLTHNRVEPYVYIPRERFEQLADIAKQWGQPIEFVVKAIIDSHFDAVRMREQLLLQAQTPGKDDPEFPDDNESVRQERGHGRGSSPSTPTK